MSSPHHLSLLQLLHRQGSCPPSHTLGQHHAVEIKYEPCCRCSVVQSCLTLCNPMDCSTWGLPVLHYLLKLAQVCVHWVGDAIQLSHPLRPSSPFAFNLSQHQALFQWVSSLHQAAKVLELQLQHQSFQLFRTDFLQDWLIWSPCSPRDSQEYI